MDGTQARLARGLWTLYEPVHAVSYFAPQAADAFEGAGLRGFWRGYFAGRSAPLGPVGAAPVIALFSSFSPPMVERAVPSIWDLANQDDHLNQLATSPARQNLLGCVADHLGQHGRRALPDTHVQGLGCHRR